jgi:hypothetical protein
MGAPGAESCAVVPFEIARTEMAAACRHPQPQAPPLQHNKCLLGGEESRSELPAPPMCPLQCCIADIVECDTWSTLAMCTLIIGAPTTLSATASSEKKSLTLRPVT